MMSPPKACGWSIVHRENAQGQGRTKREHADMTARVEHAVTDGDEFADVLMLLEAIRGGVNSLMAEILENHIRLHITHPDRGKESNEELTEDLIALVQVYLKRALTSQESVNSDECHG
jgi:DNA-binding FrmR family transcriptional regulator